MLKAIIRWARILTALTLLCILAGFLARHHRYFDIAGSFLPQYLVAAVVLAIFLMLARSWKWLAMALLCVALTAPRIVPWYVNAPEPKDLSFQRFRVMLFNVHQRNTRFAEVMRHVREVDPDVIVFQETHETWFAELRPLRDRWPHAQHAAGGLMRGMSVFSRAPLHDLRLLPFNNPESPSVAWRWEHDGKSIAMLATHPWPPVTLEADESRKRQLTLTAEYASALHRPTMLLGDLNTTMWTPSYRDFVSKSGLINARRGFGILPSHPMDELAILRVPIDHALHSDDLIVTECRLGDPCGSDHAPLIVEVAMKQVSP